MNLNNRNRMRAGYTIPALMIGMVIALLVGTLQPVMASTSSYRSTDAVDSASIGGTDFGQEEEEDDEIIGIANVTEEKKIADSTIYSINGIRLSTIEKGRIFIKNGKKYVGR